MEYIFPKHLEIWLSKNGTLGVSLKSQTFDLESKPEESYQKITNFLKSLPPSIRVRFDLAVEAVSLCKSKSERAKAISQLGYTAAKLTLHLEAIKPLSLRSLVFGAKGPPEFSPSLLEAQGRCEEVLGGGVFQLEQTKSEGEILTLGKSLEVSEGSLGLIRVHRMPSEEFESASFQEKLLSLPKPYQLKFKIQKVDPVRAKLLLEKKLKQTSGVSSSEERVQGALTEEILEKQFSESLELFEYEFFIELIRPTAELLFQDQLKIQNILSDCQTQIETYGLYPSYLSTQPGSHFHVSQLESAEVITAILPCWAHASEVARGKQPRPGQAQHGPEPLEQERRSLLIHRKLDFLEEFDLFNPNYQVSNTLIVGRSGKGKSVLTGLLTTSLLNDPNVQVIKLDVGGSHSKECELLGGTEYQMRLDEPSGINPFEVLLIPGVSLSDQIGILSKFLGNLILEQGEVVLAKNVRAEIELSVQAYIESSPSEPNLNSFFKFAKDFPRRNLLARWCAGGIYGTAFAGRAKGQSPVAEPSCARRALAETALEHLKAEAKELVQFRASGAPHSTRLAYYNFAAIFQASDPEFAQAGVAAVLSAFNMEMLRAEGKRIVLICDEVPFFVKSCFEFFKFSTANVRKYGHAVVLISQLSTDLIVADDPGLIENSPQRFLFSVDGDEEAYAKRFNLSFEDLQKIKSLKSSPRRFSEVLLQENAEDTKVLRARITPEEYWKLTTNRVDKEKLMGLLDAVPGLLLQEAITCLAMEC